jgi:hypothetical protein
VTDDGDKDMKELFDDVIGEVPPSTVDVDAAVARARRVDRMRRLASPALATVAAVAVLLGAVAVVLLSGDRGGLGSAGPTSTTRQAPTSPAPATSESPCAGMAPTAAPQPETSAVAEHRLTSVLTDVVSRLLPPGATLEKNPISKTRAGKHLGPLEAYHWYSKATPVPNGCTGGEDYYLAEATVRSAAGRGSVSVLIARSGGAGGGPEIIRCDPNVVSPDQTSCKTETSPNGDRVLKTKLGAASSKGSQTNRLDVLRTDDTFVVIESSNMATSGKYPGPPNATAIPLTQEQLKQIALDPRVTLYP